MADVPHSRLSRRKSSKTANVNAVLGRAKDEGNKPISNNWR
jgi:hypothetical protein